MGVRENKVEKYLDSEIKKLDGITRKFVSPGHDGVPDRIVRLQHWPRGVVWFVEVKTVDGKLSTAQDREQVRMLVAGMLVRTVYGEQEVDQLIEEMKSDC